jgi:hypothetical protein
MLFFLVYGAEAVLPTDLEYGSPRLRGFEEEPNQQALEDLLDQIDEARDVAMMHSASRHSGDTKLRKSDVEILTKAT